MSLQLPEQIKEPFSPLPIGVLKMRIEDAIRDMIGNENPKFGVRVALEVEEPLDAEGLSEETVFIFGTDEDPGTLEGGVKPETYTAKAGRFAMFCDAAGVEARGKNLDVVLSDLKDHRIKSRTTATKEPAVVQWGKNKGQANPYAGRYRVRTAQWYSANEGPAYGIQTTVRELEAKDNNGGGTAASSPSLTTAQAPPPPAAPSPRAAFPRTR